MAHFSLFLPSIIFIIIHLVCNLLPMSSVYSMLSDHNLSQMSFVYMLLCIQIPLCFFIIYPIIVQLIGNVTRISLVFVLQAVDLFHIIHVSCMALLTSTSFRYLFKQ